MALRLHVNINTLRKMFHTFNPFMILMWKIGLGKMINMFPSATGRIMLIKHRGRKSGKEYLTPVNYALVDGAIYCTAGFGSISDWYKNILVNPTVELWLPEGKRETRAEDISDSLNRLFLLRQMIIASRFAGPMFGVDQKKLNDEQFNNATRLYRLIHFAIS